MTLLDLSHFKDPDHPPMVCLTAYTMPMAQALDGHVDLLLVGDSLGMVLYGFETTREVDLDLMIRHGQAVVKGTSQSHVIVDMPFGSYEDNKDMALHNARKVMDETGCAGLKLEGVVEMAPVIAHLIEHDIPVIGHVGLMPQKVRGRFQARGRDKTESSRIIEDAKALAGIGVAALVIEAVMEDIARDITKAVHVPTIGIGASPDCDGQILVTEDMIGMTAGELPKFVKQYGAQARDISRCARAYADDVRRRKFPCSENIYQREKARKSA